MERSTIVGGVPELSSGDDANLVPSPLLTYYHGILAIRGIGEPMNGSGILLGLVSPNGFFEGNFLVDQVFLFLSQGVDTLLERGLYFGDLPAVMCM